VIAENLLVVSYGGGVNSTALLIGYAERGIRPDLILFADTGGELPRTYAFVEEFKEWLKSHDMPAITVVSNARSHQSLEDECLTNRTLPSLAFGFRGCSVKWKRQPMDRYIRDEWEPAKAQWEAGRQIHRAIGIDAGETHRGKIPDDKRFTYEFPLIEWDWGRDECIDAIHRAGLTVPGKSSCWFCPALKKHEVITLADNHPKLFARCVELEHNAKENLRNIKGLGRRWSWEDLVAGDRRQMKLFPETQDIPCICFDGED